MTISLIGNTGNLGIPLGIALFGEMSIAYTSIINIANIFFIYTVGVYFFAKSSYSLKESIKQIFKIPILWVAVLALIYNYSSFTISGDFERVLQMGSYSAIVLQLMIFGIYLAKTPIKSHNYRLSFSVSFVKLILLPLVGFMVILYFGLDRELAYILMLSLFVPLAVNSVNIASLYGCKPYSVSAVILVSSLLFLIFIYLDLLFLEKFL
jgi:predicted permease